VAHKNIPISFRFLKLPVLWTVSTNHTVRGIPARGTVLSGQIAKGQSPEDVRLSPLDGWNYRGEFFGLPENDPARLAEFLNRVGVWSSDPESAALDWSRYPLYVSPDDIWLFRQDLKDALLYQKKFSSDVTPRRQMPKTLFDLMTEPYRAANEFPLHFELSNVVTGVVTVLNARRMLIATVLADVANGIRFKACMRPDCPQTFPLESEHKRKFCSQYCGHLVSQRKTRAAERKERRARKSLR
jgi:hypothetical protein